jgi:hypothetical protein
LGPCTNNGYDPHSFDSALNHRVQVSAQDKFF